MGVLGTWALAVGIADLLAPREDGVRDPRPRLIAATVAVPLLALVSAAALGMASGAALWVLVVTTVSGGVWLWLGRAPQPWAVPVALTVLAVAFVGLLASPDPAAPTVPPLGRWLAPSPFLGIDAELLVLIVGLAVLQIATGNRIVRMALGQVEQGLLDQEAQLKGGRVIGPLERLLIFGLATGGQLVAAGLVVAAKSLLRFGELRRGDGTDTRQPPRAELMSEYLLVGSLLSWTLAFAAVAVVAVSAAG
jgi:hypothetical protein